MLFNSLEYGVFLPTVFFAYWFIFNNNIRLRNAFLLTVGYFFYGMWDWRFLILLFLSSTVDYLVSLRIASTVSEQMRKILLLISVTFNLCLLFFFKYFNFFSDTLAVLLTKLGFQIHPVTLNVILPVGISFYTFQSLSYTIDIYKRKMEPVADPLSFYAFVSFFPQLVAGPIERGVRLLPQFSSVRAFDLGKATDGLRQVLWGFFKKIVIADNCAGPVNQIFADYSNYSGSTLLTGAILFAFQIYCDFSGYSDIAIGTARLFGFDLMQNFSCPYFSRDIAEFWRRWHISLSTWFRDYIYIPLGGSRGSTLLQMRNTVIVFVVSGLWHGANWTFVIWGLLHAFYFLPLILFRVNRKHIEPIDGKGTLAAVANVLSIVSTFLIIVTSWIVFRSDNITSAFGYITKMFSKTMFTIPEIHPYPLFLTILILLVMEYINRKKAHGLSLVQVIDSKILRWTSYSFILLMIIYFSGRQQTFIYFQF